MESVHKSYAVALFELANEAKQLVTYHFETTLQYENFKYYFVEACINFINDYIDQLASKNRS